MKLGRVTYFFLLIQLTISYSTKAQRPIKVARGLVVNISDTIDFKYHLYALGENVYKSYTSMDEITNETPEELLKSELSATNQEWINYNHKDLEIKEPSHFARVSKLDPDKNYFALKSKLTFSLNKTPYCIVKYYIHFEGLEKPLGGFDVMTFERNRWVFTSTASTTNLAIMIESFKDSILQKVLFLQRGSDPLVNDLIDKVLNDGRVDLNLLLAEFNRWIEMENLLMKNHFLDPNRLPIN